MWNQGLEQFSYLKFKTSQSLWYYSYETYHQGQYLQKPLITLLECNHCFPSFHDVYKVDTLIPVKQCYFYFIDEFSVLFSVPQKDKMSQKMWGKAGKWTQVFHIYSNQSNHHYSLSPHSIFLPSFKIFPTNSIIQLRLSVLTYFSQIMSSSKSYTSRRMRQQDDNVQSKRVRRTRDLGCEVSKKLYILKAWEVNRVIRQCKVFPDTT